MYFVKERPGIVWISTGTVTENDSGTPVWTSRPRKVWREPLPSMR